MCVSKLTFICFDAALPVRSPAVAGSERLTQINAIQKADSLVNKSLLFLGVAILRLSEGDKLAQLPFRDSKVRERTTLQWRSLVARCVKNARVSSGRAGVLRCVR